MTTLRNKLTGESFQTKTPGNYFGSSNRASDGTPIYERVPGPKYNVRMRQARDDGHRRAGAWAILSVRDRSAWSLRTARRHLADVSKDPLFTDFYDAFEIVED